MVKIVTFTNKNVSTYSMHIWETDFDFTCYSHVLFTSTLYVAAVHEVQFVKNQKFVFVYKPCYTIQCSGFDPFF